MMINYNYNYSNTVSNYNYEYIYTLKLKHPLSNSIVRSRYRDIIFIGKAATITRNQFKIFFQVVKPKIKLKYDSNTYLSLRKLPK